jgi:hypothetical protein
MVLIKHRNIYPPNFSAFFSDGKQKGHPGVGTPSDERNKAEDVRRSAA